ncbi:MAG: ribosomal L7Ae/L30e/S12e/Gadd45 family protein [Oscillospiraceae bacterium]|nr:ribosomal L7Ae/L30e/S12e/Gadd45 family protein [Oscillospiraceae bacterium]
MAEKLKGLLGLCRRAGKLSVGHDAAVASIKSGKAFLAVTCADSSQRLKKEIADECTYKGRNIKYADTDLTMQELFTAIGARAGVIAVEESGFADRLYEYLTGGYEYDKKV